MTEGEKNEIVAAVLEEIAGIAKKSELRPSNIVPPPKAVEVGAFVLNIKRRVEQLRGEE
jgi:hypothetical protein